LTRERAVRPTTMRYSICGRLVDTTSQWFVHCATTHQSPAERRERQPDGPLLRPIPK
jgi:hypothetical protein